MCVSTAGVPALAAADQVSGGVGHLCQLVRQVAAGASLLLGDRSEAGSRAGALRAGGAGSGRQAPRGRHRRAAQPAPTGSPGALSGVLRAGP